MMNELAAQAQSRSTRWAAANREEKHAADKRYRATHKAQLSLKACRYSKAHPLAVDAAVVNPRSRILSIGI